MDTIYWHMNATKGGANLRPGVNWLPGANLLGANCAHEHGLDPSSTACLPFRASPYLLF